MFSNHCEFLVLLFVAFFLLLLLLLLLFLVAADAIIVGDFVLLQLLDLLDVQFIDSFSKVVE